MRRRSSANRLSALTFVIALRRAVKSNRRPVISAAAARDRYEPLMDVLVQQLTMEFGVEWRRSETQLEKGRRVFRTTQWIIDQPLTRFPEWERRLDATVGQVFDIVGPGTPIAVLDTVFEALEDETPAEMQTHLAAQQPETEPVVWFDGDEPLFLPLMWSARDRTGGDIKLAIRDDQTSIWATATVKSR